ncbi:unnamed protein product [Ectocarpus sp. 12 AP-2014]
MGHLHETPLAAVMEFPPLRQAFGGYCQKALCSESFQFLVDVSEFSSLVLRINGGDERGGKDDFDEFNVIVGEYITDNSNSEINIDSRTKKKLRGFCERSAYASLDQDDRANIFFQAEKEIANMLAENLLNTFKATAEYKELVGDVDFGA